MSVLRSPLSLIRSLSLGLSLPFNTFGYPLDSDKQNQNRKSLYLSELQSCTLFFRFFVFFALWRFTPEPGCGVLDRHPPTPTPAPLLYHCTVALAPFGLCMVLLCLYYYHGYSTNRCRFKTVLLNGCTDQLS